MSKCKISLSTPNRSEDLNRLVALLAAHGQPFGIGFGAKGHLKKVLVHHLGRAGSKNRLVLSVAPAQTRYALHNI